MSERLDPSRRRQLALGILFLLAVVGFSSALRIGVALRDPNFAGAPPERLLRTDPALLYFYTREIVEHGGAPPPEFRRDTRIEYPEASDFPAMETVGQEFAVAWSYLAFKKLTGSAMPLHVFCVWAMGIFASLVAVGVFGLAYELTSKVTWACLAALLWAVMLGNYRTVGFVLIREDFAFPWFALHAWLLARAARVRTTSSWVLSALALVAAMATWHAMGFVVLMEAACFLLWFLRTGENLLAEGKAWIVPVFAAVLSLAFPVLRAKQFAISLPMQVAFALLATGIAQRRFAQSRVAATAAAFGALVALFVLARALSSALGGGIEDYAHVVDLLLAKIRHLGVLPDDPNTMPFGSRLLWQGPFRTAETELFTLGLTAGSLALLAALALDLPAWIRGRGDTKRMLLTAFALAAAAAAYLVERSAMVLGFATPVLAVALLDRLRPRALGLSIAIAAIVAHGAFEGRIFASYVNPWYLPPESGFEQEHLLGWIRANVPQGEPIAADYLTSAAILAHTAHPILEQPKYETKRSRDRIEAFFVAFFQGTPAVLHEEIASHGCHWLVVNRPMLGGNRYTGGIPLTQMQFDARTAASAFLSPDLNVFSKIPGFKLVYRSPQKLRFDSYRVYRLE